MPYPSSVTMRVAIVGDYPLDPRQIWGGEQAAFSYLVRELVRIEGLEVHVVTTSRSARAPEERADESGATLHVLPAPPRFDLVRRYPEYAARLRQTLAGVRPDVVHAQGAIHHASAALRLGIPTVITVHGVQSEDAKHQKSLRLRLRKGFVSRWIERHNLARTRHLIAIGRYVTRYFEGILRADARVHHIPNAIDGRFFDIDPGLFVHGPEGGRGGTILYAGRVIRRKRVFDLVRAFAQVAARLPGARLRVAGELESEAEYAGEIRAFVEDAGLADRVAFLGSVPEDDVFREFAGCDLLALTSAQETTPMVIAQAMAAAKPVVATPVGGVAEMVEDGKTGLLVPVGDVDGIADALHRILADEPFGARLGAAAKEFARHSYRADVVARRTREVYAGMVEG